MKTPLCILLLAGLLAAPACAALKVGDVTLQPSLLGAYRDTRNHESGACSMVSARYNNQKVKNALKEKALSGIFDDSKPALTRVADVALAGSAYLAAETLQLTAVKPLTQHKVLVYVGPGAHLGGGLVTADLCLLYDPLNLRLAPNGYAAAINVSWP